MFSANASIFFININVFQKSFLVYCIINCERHRLHSTLPLFSHCSCKCRLHLIDECQAPTYLLALTSQKFSRFSFYTHISPMIQELYGQSPQLDSLSTCYSQHENQTWILNEFLAWRIQFTFEFFWNNSSTLYLVWITSHHTLKDIR